MRAGDAAPGWYATPQGRRVRVVGPSTTDSRAVWAEDEGGNRLELPVAVPLVPTAAPSDLAPLVPALPRGTCACCGWSGELSRRDRASGAVWVLPTHADRGELCQGTARTPAESELLAVPDASAPDLWGSARTTTSRTQVIRATSDVAWLERALDLPGLQAQVRLEIQTQRDMIDRIRRLAGDGPKLRAARRMSGVRSRPGVRQLLEQLITESIAADAARREAEAKVRAQRAAFRRAAGVAPPPGLIPDVPAPPTPDPIRDVLARDAAALVRTLVAADDLEPLDEEAGRLLDEAKADPLTGEGWTTERLAVALAWGRPLTAVGVLAASRRLARAVVDPVPWVRRLDVETLAVVAFAAAGRVAELPDVAPQSRRLRDIAAASLSPLAPESAGALVVRALRSLWAGGVRATLTLESE